MNTATSGQGVVGERKYKGITYWVTKTEEGWMYSVQTATGMVEDGFFGNEFNAEVSAHDTINLLK